MSGQAKVFASARIIAVLTFASRVLGLLREVAMGYFFSTDELLSAFRIAFRMPNLARRLFGEGALSAAMVPVLTESLQNDGEASSRRFVGSLLMVLSAILCGGIVVVELIVGGWRLIHDDPALRLTAITMPYVLPICLTAVISGVLNVRRSFAIPAAAPILLNLTFIAAALIFGLWLKWPNSALITAIAWTVVLGGFLQLGLSWLGLRWAKFVPTLPMVNGSVLRASWNDGYVRRTCTLLLPMTIGLSAMQLNSLADYLIAYLFIKSDGQRVGPAVLGFAETLYQLPLGVLGISLATAIFPVLSEKYAAGDHQGMADTLIRGIRMTLVTAIPASVGLIFIAKPLVAVLYERGRFGPEETQRVAATLVCYCLGLAFYFTQHLLVRAFYAMHDSKTPARIAGYMVAANFALNLVLVFPLQERGLALATSICSGIQIAILGVILSRRMPLLTWRPVLSGTVKIAAAAGVMCLALWWLTHAGAGAEWFARRRVLQLAVLVPSGVAIYLLAAKALRLPELGWIMERRERSTPIVE